MMPKFTGRASVSKLKLSHASLVKSPTGKGTSLKIAPRVHMVLS